MNSQAVHRDVKASGIRLRVLDSGSGPALLFLHGLFFDRTTWSGVFKELGAEFRLVAPDLPGFGDSEKPSPSRFGYSAESFAGTIADLYAALGLGRAVVVGHGLGGAIALVLASQHPELVTRLVLIDSVCFPSASDPLSRVTTLPLVGAFYFRQVWGRGGFRSYFRDYVLSPGSPVTSDRIDYYYDTFNSPASRGSALAVIRANRDTRTLIAHTARIQCPTLVLWGRDDALYPAQTGQRVARSIRGAGYALLNSGHAPQEEMPDEVAELLARFSRAQRTGQR